MVVKRNPINFEARRKGEKFTNLMLVNHFIPSVKRNEDLYAFTSSIDCILEKLSVYVSTMIDIESFSLDMILHHEGTLIKRAFEIKQGPNVFDLRDDISFLFDAGEVVRLDIVNIDSIYNKVSGVTVCILVSDNR